MTGLSRSFMLLAITSVLIGMAWGIQMSATHDHTLAPAHGHLNLLGWVSCSIFAMYYHLVPAAAQSKLAGLHFWLMVVTLIILTPGIAMAINEQTEVLAKLGSVLAILAMVLFGWIVLKASPANSD